MSALLLLLACGGGPAALTHQESWELLLLNNDASLVDLRLSQTNTGWTRGGGRVRLELASRRELPLAFGRVALPAEVEPLTPGLRVGPDEVRAEGEAWSVLLQEEELDARLTLRPSFSPAAPLGVRWDSERGSWATEAPLPHARARGFLRAGIRDELIDADAVLLRRHGDDPPTLRGTQRAALFAFAPGFSLGIDQLGSRALTWLWADGSALPVPEASLRPAEGGAWAVDLGSGVPLAGAFQPTRRPRVVDPLDADLLGVERWLLRAWRGTPTRTLRGGTLLLRGPEGELRLRALLLTVEYQ